MEKEAAERKLGRRAGERGGTVEEGAGRATSERGSNSFDTQKAWAHMGVYFSRMKELKIPHVTPHMQFMLEVCAFLFFFSVLV